MKRVRITAVRKTCYPNLMAKYENPTEQPCEVEEGRVWVTDGLCGSAWETMASFVKVLTEGGRNFYDGWMKDPHSAMVSCNDGFRPVRFYLEALDP